MPRLETNFLGDSGQDTLTVTETFAPGTSLESQDTAAREVEQVLIDLESVDTVQTTVGTAGGPEAAFFGGGSSPKATFSLTLAADADGVEAQQEVGTRSRTSAATRARASRSPERMPRSAARRSTSWSVPPTPRRWPPRPTRSSSSPRTPTAPPRSPTTSRAPSPRSR
ncbi:hypothetical protein NKG05_20040 [Oerskovia sp. M15]